MKSGDAAGKWLEGSPVSFSPIAIEHIANPRNAGALEGATHQGVAGDPGGGPYVILWLRVEGDVIKEATYETYGCPAAVATSSIIAQLLRGRTVAQALSITPNDLLLILGGLPPGKEGCPQMAVAALRHALEEGE